MRKRKKLLSLLTAVALCVSYMMPTAALAAAGERASSNDTAVAEVTIDGVTTQYDDIVNAFESTENEGDATLKLLKDTSTSKQLSVSRNTPLTFDLNGHTLRQNNGSDVGFLWAISGKLTIQDSVGTGKLIGTTRALYLSSNADVTITGGTFVGEKSNGLLASDDIKVQLQGGTFCTENESEAHSIWYMERDVKNLLANGYGYLDENGLESGFGGPYGSGNPSYYQGVVGKTTVGLPTQKIAYIDANGSLTACAKYTTVTGEANSWIAGWYVVEEDTELSSLNISGDVNLILCDGATLTINGELAVSQSGKLNIYFQRGGTGKLTAGAVAGKANITVPASGMKKTCENGSTTFEKCLNHQWEESPSEAGKYTCSLCGATYTGAVVASVEHGDGNEKKYFTLAEALSAAQTSSGSVLRLMENVTAASKIEISSTFTIDLNGKTLYFPGSDDYFLTVNEGGKLTIRDSETGGAINNPKSTLCVNSGGALYVTGGAFSSSTNGNALIVFDGATVQLSGGAFDSMQNAHSIWVMGSGTADSLLAPDYHYQNDNGIMSLYSADGKGVKGKTTVCKGKLECTKHELSGFVCEHCGRTIVAHDESGNYYISLSEAFARVVDNGTVSVVSGLPEKASTFDFDKEIILNLGGGGQIPNNATADATLTVSSGKVALPVNGSTYPNTIQNTGGGAAIAVTNNGTLDLAGPVILKGGLQMTGNGALTGALKEGDIFAKEKGSFSVSVEGSNKYDTVSDLLGNDLAFAKATVTTDSETNITTATAGDIVSGNVAALTEDVIVVKHDVHDYTNGVCACGRACEHQTVDSATHKCAACGFLMAAKDDSGNYYVDLADAVKDVEAGGTVTMLKDAENVTVSSSFKLDCNGHTIGTLTIGEGIELDSLLLDGYAFKSGDSWITNESGKSFSNVTTALAPVKSVTANNPNINVKYGESYTLYTTFAWTGDANSSARIKWEYASGGYIHEQAPTLTGYENNSRTMDYTFSPAGRYPAQIGTCTYVVTFTKDGYSKSCEFNVTIEKGQAKVATAPAAKENLVYSGNEQTLVTAGTANGGEMRYSLEKDGTYSAEIPTAITAGEHVVWYKVVGDSNHNDAVPASIKVTISQATPVCNAPTGATATYGQKLREIQLTNPDDNTPGTWVWADGTQNVGNYGDNTFKAIFTPTDAVNYKTVSNINVTVKVGKAEGSVTAPVAKKLTYNGENQVLTEAATSETGTVEYSIGDSGVWQRSIPTAKDAGSYVVNYRVIGDSNHKPVDAAGITVTIAPAPVTVTAKDKSVNVGEKAPDLSAPKLGSDYMVAGLFGGDTLTTAPVLKYADANGNDITPDTTKAGEAAKIVASGANAGSNYTISYTPGKLTVSVPYTPSPAPDPTPSPKPDPSPNPEPDQPSDPSTPDTPQPPAKGDAVTAGIGSAQLGFTVTGVADASGKGGTVAFTGCSKSAKKVAVPASIEINGVSYAVTEIAPGAFKNCKKLTKVTVPNFISKIGKGAFQGCTNLKSVTLGSGLKSIGKEAFMGCKSLRTIIITSNQFSKKSIKDCLKGSKVESIIVQVGSKKQNKKAAEKYAKIFTKKIAGKKAKVKASKKPLKK